MQDPRVQLILTKKKKRVQLIAGWAFFYSIFLQVNGLLIMPQSVSLHILFPATHKFLLHQMALWSIDFTFTAHALSLSLSLREGGLHKS